MAIRFRKRIKIAPGLTLNIGKKGLSTTLGPRGASINIGKQGTHANISVPGTGISLRQRLLAPNRRKSSQPPSFTDTGSLAPQPPSPELKFIKVKRPINTNITIEDLSTDPIEESLVPEAFQDKVDFSSLFTLIILKSRSKAWSLCKSLCQKASSYTEQGENIAVGFENNFADITILCDIIDIAGKWKNTFAFIKGRRVKDNIQLQHWIGCYAKHLKNGEKKGYCSQRIYTDNFTGDEYVYPCQCYYNNCIAKNFDEFTKYVAMEASGMGLVNCPAFSFEHLAWISTEVQQKESVPSQREIENIPEKTLPATTAIEDFVPPNPAMKGFTHKTPPHQPKSGIVRRLGKTLAILLLTVTLIFITTALALGTELEQSLSWILPLELVAGILFVIRALFIKP